MFPLFKFLFCPNVSAFEAPEERTAIQRLQEMQKHAHQCPVCLDIIDRVHARLINRTQYEVEHNGIAYWCNETYQVYNPYKQPASNSWGFN